MMEGSVLNVPGVFQPRAAFCCLACALKGICFKESFVRTLVSSLITVEQVAAGRDDETRPILEKMMPHERKTIISICDSLMQVHGKHYAPVVHPNYFQRATLPLSTVDKVCFAEIGRGQVLEIFQPTRSSVIAKSILEQLKEQSMINNEPRYADLPELHYNKCIWICTSSNKIKVSAPDQTQDDVYDLNHGIGDCNAFFQELLNILLEIDSVSCIIVDSITCNVSDASYNPCAHQWIQFFSWIYGSISEIVLALTIDYEDYERRGHFTKYQIKEMVNSQVEPVMIGNIKCIDVSSKVGQYFEPTEEENEANVDLILFEPPWTN